MKGRGSTSPQHPNNKWNSLHHFIKERRLAILALQETHTDDNLVETLTRLYGRRLAIFASQSENPTATAGVAIVVNKDLVNTEGAKATEIIPGRAILLELPWHQTLTLRILNVYAPNSPQGNAKFWEEIAEIWDRGELPKPDICLGDFNMVEDPMDRMPHRRDDINQEEALASLMERFRLKDGWRETHPAEIDFSFPVFQRDSRSRIDRIYATRKLIRLAENWEIEISQINTDHKMVTARFTDREAPFVGPGRWALPIDLLHDREFLEQAEALITETKTAIRNAQRVRTADENPQAYFKRLKDDIVDKARERMKTKVPKVRKALEKLQKNLEELTKNPLIATSEDLQRTQRLIEQRIAHLQMMSNQSKRLSTLVRYRLDGETVSKYWTSIAMGRSPRDLIYTLQVPDAPRKIYVRRSDKMANLMKDYHDKQQEYTPPKGMDSRLKAIDEVCNVITKEYQKGNKDNMGSTIVEQEVLDAIRASENGRAAGINGIPYEFWKKVAEKYESEHKNDPPLSRAEEAERRRKEDSPDITWILTQVFNDISYFGILESSAFSLGWICPIYKHGDRTVIKNYRPITLLNTDYKVFTKVLATRLGKEAPSLIHPDQAGFVPGRQIHHQIRQAQLTIEYCEAVEQNGVIIALDQEKAYDKIMHDYLWKVLDKFGMPPFFTRTIKNLYANAKSVVMINGERSKPFTVTRGVRQGCPLSCLIFDLAIEPLAQLLRNSGLKGMEIPGLRERIIASLFADDTTVYLAEEDSLEDLEEILDKWTEAAGAQFNAGKMKVIPVGSEQYRERVRMWRAPNAESKTFPEGVPVLEEGASLRMLGARAGNKVNPASAWTRNLNQMEEALSKWEKCSPSLNGRRLVIQMVIGGMTQYLTKVQGMPPEVERKVNGLIRSFVWKGGKSHPVAMEWLQRAQDEGGIKLLDIKARNEAIQLTWIKDYLNMTNTRPNWAYIADALIALAIKKTEGNTDQKSKVNTFLQTWDPNLHSTRTLPRELREMLRIGKKYNVRLDTLKLPQSLKGKLPIWYHIGAEHKLKSLTRRPASQCLRRTHEVTTVNDIVKVLERTTTMHHDQNGNLRRHLPRRNCACTPCRTDRSKGCENPDACIRTAKELIALIHPKFSPLMHPPGDGLSLTPGRKTRNREAIETNEEILFDPKLTDPDDITQIVRVFADPRRDLSGRLPSLRPRPLRNAGQPTIVYTDGSSLENGDLDSRVGSGIWFGRGDERNKSLRLGKPGSTNQTGELTAILYTVQNTPPDSPLRIRSDSMYAIKGLTERLVRWEEQGWIGVENADLFQAIVAALRQRCAITTFKWVKAHNGEQGNEGADDLAERGALKDTVDDIDTTAHPGYLLKGAKLATLTQALAYKGIRELTPKYRREASEAMISRVQTAIQTHTGKLRPLSTIWKSLRSKDIHKPVQDFLWKGMNNAHKLGSYWANIPECEDRILCHHCEVEENLEHILCHCKAPGRATAWHLAKTLWNKKGKPWPTPTIGTVLGMAAISFSEDGLPQEGGADRLFRILMSETAYFIWKLRCERVIEHQNDPAKHASQKEIRNRWLTAINNRLRIDIQMTRISLSKKAIKSRILKSTWTRIVADEDSLPTNWLKAKEVLVGRVDDADPRAGRVNEPHTAG